MFWLNSLQRRFSVRILLLAAVCGHGVLAQDSSGAGSGASMGSSQAGAAGVQAGTDAVPSVLPSQTPGLPRGSSSRPTVLPGKQSDGKSESTSTNPTAAIPVRRLTDFQQLVAASIQQVLPIFGADLFDNVLTTFAPVDNIPVTPEYVIGPGDELLVQAWGQVSLDGHYTVDRTGNIYIPQVGSIHVAGLPFAKINDYIRSQMGRVFKNFDLNVNMGQLRSIQIFVVGQAARPGSYTISSLSTLVNALFATGGPSTQGSLRDIQLKRDGEVVEHFDIYDLILKGDKSKDVQLLPGDVIYIPPTGKMVAMVGSVKDPAIYELKSDTTVQAAVELAGGLTNTASTQQLRIERIAGHRDLSVMDVKLTPEGSATQLMDGDILEFSSVLDRFSNAVTLRGNVTNPGRYVWHPGMRIRDLIPNKESLVTRNYLAQHNLLGNYTAETSSFTPEGGLNVSGSGTGRGTSGSAPSTLASSATIASGIFVPKNDVIISAPDIDWAYAVIERQSAKDLSTSLIPFNLGGAVLDGDEKDNLELMAGDVVTIFSTADIRVPQSQQTRFVRLDGEFAASGVYSVLPGETLRELVARAGGLTPQAYLFGAEFTRESQRRLQQQRLDEYANELAVQVDESAIKASSGAVSDVDTLAAAAEARSGQSVVAKLRQVRATGRIVLESNPDSQGAMSLPDIPLEDGDRFVVPRVPSSINVAGAVYNANAFLYDPHRRAGDYLHLAGGGTREADNSRSFVLRADGSVVSGQFHSPLRSGFANVRIYPGDTIVVPQNLNKRSTLRNLLDIAQIVSSFGLGAAAINVLK